MLDFGSRAISMGGTGRDERYSRAVQSRALSGIKQSRKATFSALRRSTKRSALRKKQLQAEMLLKACRQVRTASRAVFINMIASAA